MKNLLYLATAASMIVAFVACEHDDRDHRDRTVSSTTTTEQTTVQPAVPSQTTTVRTY